MFVAYRSKFVATAYSILRNREDAEDAVQNAFLSAYLHLRSFEGRSALRTWFTRIVFNAALMIQRKRKSSVIAPLPENSNPYEDDWIERLPAPEPNSEVAYAERETFDFIQGILGQMQPALRQAFTMAYFDDLSHREACELLAISASTFKARLFRARREVASRTRQALLEPIRKAATSGVRMLENRNHAESARI